MPGTRLFFPEPDLSHSQVVDGYSFVVADTFFEQHNQSFSSVKSYLLPLAFLISLAIHGGFLFIKFSANTTAVVEPSNIRIHIELAPKIQQQPIADLVEIPEQVPVEMPALDKPEQTEKIIEKEITTPTVIEPVPASPAVILSLTPEELNAITGSVPNETEPTDANLTEVSSEPFGSIFHPHLRARLQAGNSSGSKARGLAVLQRANGSTVVEVSDGHCLVTQSQFRQEEATNWYHSGCGHKTEGERMMDRVNESMRARYKKTP